MPRRIASLNGRSWRLGQAPTAAKPDSARWRELDRIEEWLPAQVPGNVRADLIRAGRLPDLATATAVEEAQWVDDSCWWLDRTFPHPAVAGDRVFLILRGVDYIGDLFLNGLHLGRHEGMFSSQVHEVSGLLASENRLALRLLGSRWLPRHRSNTWERILNLAEARLGSLPGRFPHRRDTLKCQMSFGWDFAPPLRTMGIWDDVYMVVTEHVFIRDVSARQQVAPEAATLQVQAAVDTHNGRRVRLRCALEGESFQGETVSVEQPAVLPPGYSSHTLALKVDQPRLWWPWDHGCPHLYRLTVEVWEGDRQLDAHSQVIGLRSVSMEGWSLLVNGRRVFARGANWVPADILPGRVSASDYDILLTRARQANMNMLRVWGGGLREKRAFYDLCDRLGILVWQEFPFACAYLSRYPRSKDYLCLVENEARAIVRDLRNHACLAVWCGGNEFSPKHNAPMVATLRQVVEAEDPKRPFLPASPALGDSHNWRVWHRFYPPSEYRRDHSRFASEFGLQAPSSGEALRRFIAQEDLWPPGPSWVYHGAGLKKLARYAGPFLARQNPSLEGFIQASQRAQAHGLQIAIEHYRRQKARGCGGLLLWQLNEPWPAISWSLLDFYRQPKPAYDTVRRLLSPVLVSVEYPLRNYQPGDQLRANVWIVNDMPRARSCCLLKVLLWDGAGRAVNHIEQNLDVPADCARLVNSLEWELPQGGGWRLTCQLVQEGQTLSANSYDLAIHDDVQPSVRQRLWARMISLFLPS